jgi:glyoxylase-like metal-dependent hydrolase (beta-lactamase superfamily II)
MLLEVRAVPPFQKNGFLAGCGRTREAVLIDPGDEVGKLLPLVEQHGLSVRAILLTHAHLDHSSGVDEARARLGAPVHLHRDDLFLYERIVEQGKMFGLSMRPQPAPDVFYDGAPIAFGDYRVVVHHTPGHCPGEVCLQVGRADEPGRHLFVGDTLFAGSVGRTDLPGGDHRTLMRSITEVLFALGDDAIVHPGHGPDTTIARERTTNPFVLEYLRASARER